MQYNMRQARDIHDNTIQHTIRQHKMITYNLRRAKTRQSTAIQHNNIQNNARPELTL